MKLFLLMERLEAFEKLFHEIGDDVLWDSFGVMVNEVGHRTSVHELYEHEQGLFEVVCEEMFCQVLFVAQRHNCHLCFYLFQRPFVFHFYYATGVVLAVLCIFVVCEEYFTHRSFPQLPLKDEFLGRILLDELGLFDDRFELFRCQYLRLYFTLFELFFEALNHFHCSLRIILNIRLRNKRLVKLQDPFLRYIFDFVRIIQINLQMHLMLKIRRPNLTTFHTM